MLRQEQGHTVLRGDDLPFVVVNPKRQRRDVHLVLPQLIGVLGHVLHDVVRWLNRHDWMNQNHTSAWHGHHVAMPVVGNLRDLQEAIEHERECCTEREVGLDLEEHVPRTCLR